MKELKKIANDVRKDIITMIYAAKSGHPGGSLSVADILVALYHDQMDDQTDKLVLSKGHASPALYACLHSIGKISKEELMKFRKIEGILEGHPSNKIPGVDISSGSLGQGLSASNGMGMAKRLNGELGYVYCILGDGEMEEGQVWEALMTLSHQNLTNVIPIIDNNNLQIDGTIKEVKGMQKIKEKLIAFGLQVLECNGNNIQEIVECIHMAKEAKVPVAILAKTIKGKGVSFMENNVSWHGKSLTQEEYEKAMHELEVIK